MRKFFMIWSLMAAGWVYVCMCVAVSFLTLFSISEINFSLFFLLLSLCVSRHILNENLFVVFYEMSRIFNHILIYFYGYVSYTFLCPLWYLGVRDAHEVGNQAVSSGNSVSISRIYFILFKLLGQKFSVKTRLFN